MTAAAAPIPSTGAVAFILSANALLFAGAALVCWGVEALWNKVVFPSAPRRPFPPQGAMPAARALKFTAIHMSWIIWATFALTLVLSLILKLIGLELPAQPLLDWFVDPQCPAATQALIALFAIVEAPLVEEIIFRRFVFRAFLRGLPKAPAFACLLSGTVFAVVHGNLAATLPLIFLGFLFAWVYFRTGRIWTTMLIHSLFNATTVVAMLVFPGMAKL